MTEILEGVVPSNHLVDPVEGVSTRMRDLKDYFSGWRPLNQDKTAWIG